MMTPTPEARRVTKRALERELNAALRLLAATVFMDCRAFSPQFIEARRRLLKRASRRFRSNRLKGKAMMR